MDQKGQNNHNFRHGLSASPEYRAWRGMLARCYNPKAPKFKNYGGRGISVCDEWKGSFVRFLAYIGNRPGRGFVLDRIDNNSNYEPGNVRWASHIVSNNNRRNTRIFQHKGKTVAAAELARGHGLTVYRLHARLRAGWELETALNTPVRGYSVHVQ